MLNLIHRRIIPFITALALLGIVLAGLVSTLAPGAAMAAGDPQQVNFTLEGCRNDGSIVLPNGSGQFICPDAAYTTGNLGKGWNELDLVPYRLTADAGNSAPASQSYTLAIVVDNRDAGHPGYDVLSAPVLNTALSDASCTAAAASAEQIVAPGLGGIDESRYRLITITQAKNTTCVYDYYARLALGSHLFPGSSLHANLANQNLGTAGIGSKEVSIPVKEILPQELSKDMSATQGTDHVWNISKDATPARVDFANTCDPNAPKQAPVTITVQWVKQPAEPSGVITIITHVYAKNPASRLITVDVTDQIRSGTTVLNTASSGPVDVPANTTQLVLTHQTTVPAGTTDLNDIATATYTDKVTGVPVPGNTTATASANVQLSGPELNQSAVINDVESIGGADLSYSADSFLGAAGSFDGGYIAGTKTAGSVSWTSASQSGSGSVTFNKTVYVDQPSNTSGALSDVAALTGSDGFSTSANASVAIRASALVELTINKSIPDVLQAGESEMFNFAVTGPNGFSQNLSISFGAGQASNSATLSGLEPGSYTISETGSGGGKWNAQPDQAANIGLPACSGSVSFANTLNAASARVNKITVPAGDEAGWEFTLNGPGTPAGGEKVITSGAGFVSFSTLLQEGSYTIVETPKPGYDQTSASAECSFTVNYPADAGRVFSCTYTNTRRGTIIVKKLTDPPGAPGSFSFTGDASGSIGDGGTITVGDLVPGTYTSTEADPTPDFDLIGISCDDAGSATASSGDVGTRTATFKLDPGETVTCTFTNRQRGTATVVKTVSGAAPSGSQAFEFQLRQGASAADNGTVLDSQVANAGNGGNIAFAVGGSTKLVPGTYQLCEFVQVGWKSSIQTMAGAFVPGQGGDTTADNTYVCVSFVLDAGEAETFLIDNTPPPGGMAKTIGFWKNWASCSNSKGKQQPILDQTLAAAGGHILIGDLDVDTCQEAVALLNKSTLAGKKMTSDPAFNLAAQLMAYRLNIAAGAGDIPAANAAATQAQTYLADLDFNGNTHKPISKQLAATLNSLAATLDSYNNNTLS